MEKRPIFCSKMDLVVCIDNDMRRKFFGEDASTEMHLDNLGRSFENIEIVKADIRNEGEIAGIFEKYNSDIELVVHCAAQPSHDWAMREPMTDFSINATGTLNLLEATRLYADQAASYIVLRTRYMATHRTVWGSLNLSGALIFLQITTCTSLELTKPFRIDQSLHSIFGASKLAADVMAQEYGRYFGIKTGIFRGGCITGP